MVCYRLAEQYPVIGAECRRLEMVCAAAAVDLPATKARSRGG